MGIRFHSGGALTRLLVADAGEDSQVSRLTEVVDGKWDAVAPWRNLGIASERPLLTLRSSLRCVVFTSAGEWETLEDLSNGIQFALVAISAKGDEDLIIWTAPAMIEYTEVWISASDSGDSYRGRVDISLLGNVRSLTVA